MAKHQTRRSESTQEEVLRTGEGTMAQGIITEIHFELKIGPRAEYEDYCNIKKAKIVLYLRYKAKNRVIIKITIGV